MLNSSTSADTAGTNEFSSMVADVDAIALFAVLPCAHLAALASILGFRDTVLAGEFLLWTIAGITAAVWSLV